MAPMRVYRFEHGQDRKGPWCDGYVHIGFQLSADRLPMPRHDSLSTYGLDAFRYGFVCADKLRWFSSVDRRTLGYAGFILATYMVPVGAIRFGDTQVVFDPEAAILVKERAL